MSTFCGSQDISGVSKSYKGRPALRDVTLSIAPGELCVLLGPNGAGKTTLISIIAGLQRPESGSVSVRGHDVSRDTLPARAAIGLAGQETAVYPTLRVEQNLRVAGELRGLRAAGLRRHTDQVAFDVGLDQHLGRRAGSLSGGEQRRLHLAQALIGDPPVLLLDEPTVGSDLETRGRVLRLVQERAQAGSVVIYSTHHLEEVSELDSTLALLDGGRVVGRGRPAELIAELARPSIELGLTGTLPPLPDDWDVVTVGDLHRVTLAGPDDELLGRVLQALGPAASRVRSARVVTPGLEGVYLTLTGRSGDELVTSHG